MNGHDSSTSNVCLASWARHAGGVALWLTAICLLAAPLIWFLQGSDGLVAAGIAALFCTLSAIGAQLIASLLAGPAYPVHATMLATMLRMAPPLFLCMLVGLRRGPLTEAGIVFYMIGFYLVTLAVDTWLSVSRISPAVSSRKG
ncbi:MAG TPA: hypothetical protein VHD36_21905 [Pirellulales bacterium]|nr:hypothetical protein [Pirellulales bacterium]